MERRASDTMTIEHVTFGQKALAVAPLELKDVEADQVLQVHQNHHQGVELVSQPEVCKLYAVKRRSEHAKLQRGESQRARERKGREASIRKCAAHSQKLLVNRPRTVEGIWNASAVLTRAELGHANWCAIVRALQRRSAKPI